MSRENYDTKKPQKYFILSEKSAKRYDFIGKTDIYDKKYNKALGTSKLKRVKWTKEQRDAIVDSGNNLLLSASAGSGKTAVMTARIIYLLRKEKIDINSFLVVTFTSASAKEMKNRIIDALSRLPKTDFTLKQIENVATSDISDLHSFYSRLIQTYFYEVQVDPNYRIIDQIESKFLRDKAIKIVFDKMQSENDQQFFKLYDIFQSNRSFDRLADAVTGLSDYLAAHYDGENVFKEKIEKTYDPDTGKNICVKMFIKSFLADIRYYEKRIDDFLEICAGSKKYSEYFNNLKTEFAVFNENMTLELMKNKLDNFEPGKLPIAEKDYKIFSDDAKQIKEEIKEFIARYYEYVPSDTAEFSNRLLGTKENIYGLFNLTQEFNATYNKLKRDLGGLDFNDLEKYALKVLENDKIRGELKKKYKYIFVDEYQDINEVQEKVISLLSSDNNRFMVGDLKQSIYRFRLCDPEIFLEKYRLYSSDGSLGKVIKLNCNFRSDKNILRFCDDIFSEFMTKDFGDIDYKSEAMFVAGENSPEKQGSVNLCYIRPSETANKEIVKGKVYSVKEHDYSNDSEMVSSIVEARLVASKIAEILAEADKNKSDEDKLRLSDFAILVFSMNTYKIMKFIEEFKKFGYPVTASSKEDMTKHTHIAEIINFAKLCVNDKDDYLLFNVLKSKLFDFTDEEIIQIRNCDREVDFYDTIGPAMEDLDENLRAKVNNFRQTLEKYRVLSRVLSISDFCRKVVKDFKLEKLNLLNKNGHNYNKEITRFLASLPNVSVVEFAVSYEDFSLEPLDEGGDDAIQIMTVHKSKGMQFKYVFVVNTGAEINYDSVSDTIIFNKECMVAMNYFDYEKRSEIPLIPMGLSRIIEKRKIAEEQLRVFYVALTRAQSKLFVICSKDNITGKKKRIPTCYSDWLETILYSKLTSNCSGYDYINFEEYDASEFLKGAEDNEKTLKLSKIDAPPITEFNYEFAASTAIGLKNSVSKIIKNAGATFAETADEGSESPEEESEADIFGSETAEEFHIFGSSAERGTAYHRFFELFDFGNIENIDGEILTVKSKLNERELSEINFENCKKILLNPLFKEISGLTILKEREFFAAVPASLINSSAKKTDNFIMQGVIDLMAFSDDKLIILDYKTGKYTPEKMEKYKFQIEVYSDICKRTLKRQTSTNYLCFIDEQKIVKI